MSKTKEESDEFAFSAPEQYADFNIRVVPQERGIKLEFENAPISAFVDGHVIVGIQEQLFSVLRDIVYIRNQIETNQNFDLNTSDGITNAVFHILRNAKVLIPETEPNLVVCWGGHSIHRDEAMAISQAISWVNPPPKQ